MARKITLISELRQYLRGIFNGRLGDAYPRINHATQVDETVMEIAGHLVMTADDNSIEVGQRTTKAGIVHDVNMVWFTVQGRPRTLVYNSAKGVLEIRDQNRGGGVLASLTNTNKGAIATAFRSI
jgi:hypothetical protein